MILLIGQPTLRRQMKTVTLAALQQRVGIRYAMPPMSGEETGSYAKHHLALAGRSDTLFSDDAVALIHTTARGYPRAVNNLALQALVATYAARKAIVDESAARAAVAETDDDQQHLAGTTSTGNDTTPAKPHRNHPVGLFNAATIGDHNAALMGSSAPVNSQ